MFVKTKIIPKKIKQRQKVRFCVVMFGGFR